MVSPIADTATTTSLPALRVSTMRFATRLMLSASATDEPPNFCTIRATTRLSSSTPGGGASVYRRVAVAPRPPDPCGAIDERLNAR